MASAPDADRDDVVEVAPDRKLGLGILLAGLLILTPPLVTASPESRPLALSMLTMLVAVAGAITWWSPLPIRRAVELSLDGDAVVLKGTGRSRRLRRDHIDRIEIGRTDRPTRVSLVRRWRTVRLEVRDRARARDLIARLRLQRGSSTFWTMSPLANSYPAMWAMGVVHFVVAIALSTVAIPLSVATLFAWPVTVLWPARRITVGADGLELRWLGRSRHVPHANVQFVSILEQRVGAIQHGVTIGLHSGERIRIAVPSATTARALASALSTATAARAPASPPLWLSDRGERSLRDWVAHLRRPDAAGLRDQAPSKTDLFRVVEDGSAQPIDRASAAIALGRTLSDDDRRRLAEITEGVAAPKLRVVLEHTLDEDDEALASMLEPLEANTR